LPRFARNDAQPVPRVSLHHRARNPGILAQSLLLNPGYVPRNFESPERVKNAAKLLFPLKDSFEASKKCAKTVVRPHPPKQKAPQNQCQVARA
jgi:hypothetical protein